MVQSVCIFGATGSIGQSTLKVLDLHPDQYSLYAVSGHSRMTELAQICQKYHPKVVIVPNSKIDQLTALFKQFNIFGQIEILSEENNGLVKVAQSTEVDIVMAAIVGAAGLLSTLAAVQAGKRVLLANKEALVMSGDLMMQSAHNSKALLLPVDSEHNAIFQSLPYNYTSNYRALRHQQDNNQIKEPINLGVSQILLTASGGPFLNFTQDQLEHVTPAQACKHPNWSMGKKISVDSATLMNKGLELIEACHLFTVKEHKVTVVIHPESIIHSMVQYIDGSTLAQMGNPDMCTPIAHALSWPERIEAPVAPLDLFKYNQLNFTQPDEIRFPSLRLARQAMQAGGVAPTILNAANEIAVEAFLQGKIKFTAIPDVVEKTLNKIANASADSIEFILATDNEARKVATAMMDH